MSDVNISLFELKELCRLGRMYNTGIDGHVVLMDDARELLQKIFEKKTADPQESSVMDLSEESKRKIRELAVQIAEASHQSFLSEVRAWLRYHAEFLPDDLKAAFPEKIDSWEILSRVMDDLLKQGIIGGPFCGQSVNDNKSYFHAARMESGAVEEKADATPKPEAHAIDPHKYNEACLMIDHETKRIGAENFHPLSMIQRRLSLGYSEAAAIVEKMKKDGVIPE